MPEILGSLRPPRLSSAPGSPALGELYYDTGTSTLYWWNGSVWISSAGAGSPPDATTSSKGIVQLAGDLSGTAAAPLIASGAIANAEIAAAADIEGSKLNWHVGSTPPGSPTDGMIWIYSGSGFYWMLVYDSSETTYKWKFIGGGELTAAITTDQTFSAGAWGDATTPGPTVTVPRAGDYEVIAAANEYIATQTAGGTMYAGVTASSGTWDSNGTTTESYSSLYTISGTAIQFVVSDVIRGIAASGTLKMRYNSASGLGGTNHVRNRIVKVRPRRIS